MSWGIKMICFAICCASCLDSFGQNQARSLVAELSYGQFSEFEASTNAGLAIDEPRYWSAGKLDAGYGADISYFCTKVLYLGANIHFRHIDVTRNLAHRSLTRGHMVAGIQGQFFDLNAEKTGSEIQALAQWELGRIAGSHKALKGDTWNYGATLGLNYTASKNLGVSLKGSIYWHKEDFIGAIVIPQRTRLIGARLALRYNIVP